MTHFARPLVLALTLAAGLGCSETEPGDGEAERPDTTAAETATPPQTTPSRPKIEDDPGLVVHASQRGFDETATALDDALGSRGLRVFAVVDHARNAADAGIELSPTRIWIFGNPEVGTPLIEKSRTVAIDLPQKIVVWEEGPAVRIGYNDPLYLAERHDIPADTPELDAIARALDGIAREAAGLTTGSATAETR